ncbi:MAG: hypothetical protein J7L08_03405 [Candidatus Aenigmarchaeota archaeon]|nr:hypothetical protein [Candidatus Aenigmarchaeota archaeon]
MLIGIDMDDVLGDFVGGLVEYHNETYGTSFKKDDFSSFDFWKVWGGDKESAVKKVCDFYETPYFKNLKPIEGSIEAVDELSKHHELMIITSRPEYIKKETLEWVERYFPDKFKEVYFAKNSYMNPTTGKEKLELCLEKNVDVLVEDALQHIYKYTHNGRTKVFLYDSPWNRNKTLPSNVKRVKSWNEIVKLIKIM